MKKILLFLSFLLMSIGVWGATETLTESEIKTHFTSSVHAYGSGAVSFTDGDVNWYFGDYTTQSVNSKWIQINKGQGIYLKITTPVDTKITEVFLTVTSADNSKGGAQDITKHNAYSGRIALLINDITGSATMTGVGYTNTITSNTATISVSGTNRELYLKTSAAARIWGITVTYTPITIFPKDTVFWLVNGDTIYKDIVEHNSQVDTVPHISINDYCDDAFIGWTNSIYQNSTPPDVLFTTTKPIITQDTTFYAVFGNYESGNITSFFKTELNEITISDVFIIVGKKGSTYYAMSNDNGTSKDPDAPIVNPINDCISSPDDTILWKLSGNNSDGYIFYPYNDNTKWLYCNTKTKKDNNDNLRVGNIRSANSDRKLFIRNNDGYFENRYDTCSTRYVGVYTDKPDWRSYTSINANISGQTFEFYKGTRTIDEYHTNTDCVRKFNNAQNDSLWTTKGNWTNNKIPTIKYGARIDNAVLVDTTHAVAKHVIINQNTGNGKIIIKPNKGLEVDSTIVVSKNNSYHSTTPNDLILESSDAGNASLIFNNNNQNSATVNLYSKATNPGLDGFNADWQYVGTTMTSLNALYNYYGSWLYEWVGGDEKWRAVPNGGTMEAWKGYCITQNEIACHETSGQLVPTSTKTLDIYAPYTVVANSWTAPIHIGAFRNADFNSITDMRIYLFNTGFDPGGDSTVYETRHNSPGTYVVIPIHAAPYLDKDSLIPSQQGFFVKTSTNGHLILDYDRIVRTGGSGDIVAGPLRAPRRAAADDKPNVLKIYANGSRFSDRLTILEREDFTTNLDNGWDGDKMSFSNLAPSIYVINEDGSYDEVSAIPDYEGTLIGFKAGTDIAYSITFDYDGDETIYLNDMLTQTSTLIDNESKYVFTSDGSEEVRFVISVTPYAGVATDIDKLTEQSNTTHKFLYNGNLYILKNNCIFNVVGSLVK